MTNLQNLVSTAITVIQSRMNHFHSLIKTGVLTGGASTEMGDKINALSYFKSRIESVKSIKEYNQCLSDNHEIIDSCLLELECVGQDNEAPTAEEAPSGEAKEDLINSDTLNKIANRFFRTVESFEGQFDSFEEQVSKSKSKVFTDLKKIEEVARVRGSEISGTISDLIASFENGSPASILIKKGDKPDHTQNSSNKESANKESANKEPANINSDSEDLIYLVKDRASKSAREKHVFAMKSLEKEYLAQRDLLDQKINKEYQALDKNYLAAKENASKSFAKKINLIKNSSKVAFSLS